MVHCAKGKQALATAGSLATRLLLNVCLPPEQAAPTRGWGAAAAPVLSAFVANVCVPGRVCQLRHASCSTDLSSSRHLPTACCAPKDTSPKCGKPIPRVVGRLGQK